MSENLPACRWCQTPLPTRPRSQAGRPRQFCNQSCADKSRYQNRPAPPKDVS